MADKEKEEPKKAKENPAQPSKQQLEAAKHAKEAKKAAGEAKSKGPKVEGGEQVAATKLRLKDKYQSDVIPALMEKFQLKNKHASIDQSDLDKAGERLKQLQNFGLSQDMVTRVPRSPS